jgi:hypothetical protein
MHVRGAVLDQRKLVWVHAHGQRRLALEQLYNPATPTTNVQNTGVGVGVWAGERFVYLSALAPARVGGGVASPQEILAVEV